MLPPRIAVSNLMAVKSASLPLGLRIIGDNEKLAWPAWQLDKIIAPLPLPSSQYDTGELTSEAWLSTGVRLEIDS